MKTSPVPFKVTGQIFNLIFLSIGLFFWTPQVMAQQPFMTDDTDVTGKGHLHFEISSEFDKLPSTSRPVKYQNGVAATLDYGLCKNLEISFSGDILTLVNNSTVRPHYINGTGDSTISFKYNFYHERKESKMPALAVSGFIQLPSGDASRSLGSGVTDYGFYAGSQKTYRQKNVLRLNGGYLFAANTLNGAEGISLVKGKVFTGGVSFVRKLTDKLQLGAELTGAVTGKFQLSSGQLQTQFGGNYQINKKTNFDFGLILGRYPASPRIGMQIGFSIDF